MTDFTFVSYDDPTMMCDLRDLTRDEIIEIFGQPPIRSDEETLIKIAEVIQLENADENTHHDSPYFVASDIGMVISGSSDEYETCVIQDDGTLSEWTPLFNYFEKHKQKYHDRITKENIERSALLGLDDV